MGDIDRLAEVKKSAGLPIRKDSGSADDIKIEMQHMGKDPVNKDISAHMKAYEPVKEKLSVIRRNITLIEKLKDKEATTVNEDARKEIMSELENITQETSQAGSFIKKKLDDVKKDLDEHKKKDSSSATTQMKINLYQTNLRRFHQTMNTYNQAAHKFKKALRDRTRRELAIVDTNLSPEQVDKIVDEGKAQDYFREALISEQLDSVVQEIEERHKGIVKLEQHVLELYELFRDLETLVDLQQESLDIIENRITLAKDYAEKAEEELISAEDYQKKARKRMCCIIMIIVIVVAVVLGTAIPLSGI